MNVNYAGADHVAADDSEGVCAAGAARSADDYSAADAADNSAGRDVNEKNKNINEDNDLRDLCMMMEKVQQENI